MSDFVSKEIYEKLKKDLENLKAQRKEIAERLKRSIGYGDISENSEYQQAREDKEILEKKILDLEQKLKKVKVKEKSLSNDKVSFYSKVKVKDKDGNELDLILVSSEEADFSQGKISCDSPIGKALLGKKIGDIIKIKKTYGEKKEYKIISIS